MRYLLKTVSKLAVLKSQSLQTYYLLNLAGFKNLLDILRKLNNKKIRRCDIQIRANNRNLYRHITVTSISIIIQRASGLLQIQS